MEDYLDEYSADLLQPLKRSEQRKKLSPIESSYHFEGADVWHAYEFTWLNKRGKPEIAVPRFEIEAGSQNFVESKSFKLYLGSFAGSIFSSKELVLETLEKDLSVTTGSQVSVSFLSPMDLSPHQEIDTNLVELDELDIDISEYEYDPDLLQGNGEEDVSEVLFTNLFRSLCPMTAQPDFASVTVDYRGLGIEQESLLRYLVSFRRYAAFSEHVVERIYFDLLKKFSFTSLCVSARYTRRGGLDINPHRLFNMLPPKHSRDLRQ